MPTPLTGRRLRPTGTTIGQRQPEDAQPAWAWASGQYIENGLSFGFVLRQQSVVLANASRLFEPLAFSLAQPGDKHGHAGISDWGVGWRGH